MLFFNEILTFLWDLLDGPHDWVHSLEFWRTVSLGSVAIGQTLFTALYATFPWYRTFLGRALFYKALTLTIITVVFLLARIFGWVNLDVLFVVLYSFLAFGVWWQFAAFVAVKREGRDKMLARREEERRYEDV